MHTNNKTILLKHDLKNMDFRPFGISIFNDKLFVVNEGYEHGGESVLVFKIMPNWELKFVD